MRKIEREMIQAIIERSYFKKANTKVTVVVPKGADSKAEMRVYLHDNHIATYTHDGKLWINHCGWKTVTTKSRLNALVKHHLGELSCVYQKNFDWFVRQTDNATGTYDTYEFPDGWLLV